MVGYYKDPEHSAEAIDAEGWLHTGDMGKLDKEGYLTITGRMKDVFKTAKGKYVAPVPIEGLLGQEPIIEQLCVIGYGMPQPIALVQLAESAMKGNREEVNARLEAARVRVNDQLESHAKIRGILVVKTPLEYRERRADPHHEDQASPAGAKVRPGRGSLALIPSGGVGGVNPIFP